MNNKAIITALIIAASMTGQAQEQLLSVEMCDSLIVSGRVRNIPNGMPHTLIINECDISDKSARAVCELDADGSFCQKIPFSFPHTFTVNYNVRNFINAFAAPGDSVYMDIDASTTPLTVDFSGSRADINNLYDAAFQHINSFYWSVSLPDDSTAYNEYMPVFSDLIRQGRDIIDAYAVEHGLSDEVISMLYADNTFILANLAMGYRGTCTEDMRNFFLDPVFDIFNEDNTKVMIFPYHISAIVRRFPDVRNHASKGLVRDLMYACDDDAEVPDRVEFYNRDYYDRLYVRQAQVRDISIDGIKGGNSIVFVNDETFEFSDVSPLEWLVHEYEGHPIYLDISATWCGPCRAALNDSEDFRKHYKDTDIVFAVVWLRSTKEAWLKVAPTISNAVQIFVDDVEMADLIMGKFNITGFPTYLMIDREGKFIKGEVPDYHSAELPLFLNGYR